MPAFTPRTPVPPPIIDGGILPGGQVHLFSGASGTGKSALIYQLLAAALNGTDWLGFKLRTTNFVGLITSDRRGDDHQEWLQLLGIENKIPTYNLIDDHTLSGTKLRTGFLGGGAGLKGMRTNRFDLFTRSVEQLVAKAGLPTNVLPWDTLLIVDPLSLFLGSSLNDYNSAFTHMFDLSQWCVVRGATMIGIVHAGKQRGDPKIRYSRPQDRILGSTAQTSCAGTTLHLAPPTETDEGWSEIVWVPHHAAAGVRRLLRDEKGLFVVASDVEATRAEQISLKLLLLFPDLECHRAKDLVREAEMKLGLKRSQTYNYLNLLCNNGMLEVVRRGQYRRRPTGEA